ncbi:MAG: NAD(P)/FAD-dependent oxidoreductase, partial [Bacillota bacterium]|nr:NAD(P)/FAD-dependent oxidoreductase [Bacillota bacterium]
AFGNNGSFLYSAFYTFSNFDAISFFNELGLETKVERGNRVFPKSDEANEVVTALVKFVKAKKVKIRLEARVKQVLVENKSAAGVQLFSGEKIYSNHVILAVGGASYPGTGSTGDGYDMAKTLGHEIIPIKPALIPLVTKEDWVKELQGLALKNVELEIIGQKTKLFGEMLFTHFGISGPIVLTLSNQVQELLERNKQPIAMAIDLKPALTEEKLDLRLQRDFEKYQRKQLGNSLGELLPKALIPVILKLAKLEESKFVHQVTKEERRSLVTTLKSLPLTITSTRPLSEAIVTAGGVSVKEINPRTMESKLIKGLYLAGELIDIDGITGGFNLQAAFSTGFIAGMTAGQETAGKRG